MKQTWEKERGVYVVLWVRPGDRGEPREREVRSVGAASRRAAQLRGHGCKAWFEVYQWKRHAAVWS